MTVKSFVRKYKLCLAASFLAATGSVAGGLGLAHVYINVKGDEAILRDMADRNHIKRFSFYTAHKKIDRMSVENLAWNLIEQGRTEYLRHMIDTRMIKADEPIWEIAGGQKATPFLMASLQGKTDIMRMLVKEYGVNPNSPLPGSEQMSPTLATIFTERREALGFLLNEAGVNAGPEIIRDMIERGLLNDLFSDLMEDFYRKNKIDLPNPIVRNSPGMTIGNIQDHMYLALAQDNIKWLEFLLATGISPDFRLQDDHNRSETLLIGAVKNGKKEIADILLLHGASPHLSDKGGQGYNALEYAAIQGDKFLLGLMINDYGARVTTSCFLLAKKNGHDDLAQKLYDVYVEQNVIVKGKRPQP